MTDREYIDKLKMDYFDAMDMAEATGCFIWACLSDPTDAQWEYHQRMVDQAELELGISHKRKRSREFGV